MQLKLIVIEGSRLGMEVPVPGPKFFVGRDEDCQLRPNSDMVSRHHCVLLVEQGYAAVRDFGSKNGTYVNDERIVGEKPLKAGDTITIGPLKFEVVVHHGVGGPKRPKVKDVKEAATRTISQTKNDADISSWLTDAEAVVGAGAADTTELDSSRIKLGEERSLSDTAALAAEATTDVAKRHEEATRIEKEPAEEAPPAEGAGGAPRAKDTQSAALDTLKKLRQQKMQQVAQGVKPSAKNTKPGNKK